MGILDGIVEWIAEQVMNGLDLITTSVLGALGCDMTVFLRYFPAAETMCMTMNCRTGAFWTMTTCSRSRSWTPSPCM